MDLRVDAALVILCGGRARRMGGRAKPLLRFADGTSLLARALARLGPAVAEVWISATEDTAAPLGREVCVPQVVDRGRGPARALVEAARVARVPWIALVGGDQPGVGPAVLGELARGLDGGAAAAVASVEERRWPMPGLYRRDALLALPDAEVDDASLQWVLDRLGAAEVRGVPLEALNSVNTPEEARAAGLVPQDESTDHRAADASA